MTVTPPKAEFIVKLKKVRQPDRFPAPEQAAGQLLIVLGSLGFNVDLMAQQVHHIERIKLAVAFNISGANQIGLVNIVNAERLSEIWVLNAFRNIRSFF